jgi:molybdenum cofactor guanylyltransferase
MPTSFPPYLPYPISGIILSGGRSLRMGTNKAFISIEGLPIIKRISSVFKELFDETIIVTNEKDLFLDLGVRLHADLIPNRGALGGLYTGLSVASHAYSFCVASDMPYLKRAVVQYLIQNGGNHDVIVPETADGMQPLHALYSKNCLRAIEEAIYRDKHRILDFYPSVRVKVIREEEFLALDPLRESFININTPEELVSVRGRKGIV